MTRRRATIRRAAALGDLDANDEVAAAGALCAWWVEPVWSSARFWRALAIAHGKMIRDKVRETRPGCRAGMDYAIGLYPPIPLLEPVPESHVASRDFLDVDGVRHWHCGGPWQMCQAEHLRAIGEVDGAEWQRYLAWKRRGFPAAYTVQGFPGKPMTYLPHLCH